MTEKTTLREWYSYHELRKKSLEKTLELRGFLAFTEQMKLTSSLAAIRELENLIQTPEDVWTNGSE